MITYALGHVLLLVAFTLGLPSLDPVDDDDIEDAEDYDYDEDNDDGFEETEDDVEDDPA